MDTEETTMDRRHVQIECAGVDGLYCGNTPRLGEDHCGACLDVIRDRARRSEDIRILVDALLEGDRELAAFLLEDLLR